MSSGVRFAPSPTGRFHIGNLRTAWVSSELASAIKEPWMIRIEDIDTMRVLPKAWDDQSADLARLGLVADSVITQSANFDRHLELFERAKAEGRVYPCDCSRQDVLESLAQMERAPHTLPPEYSGHCRKKHFDGSALALSKYSPKETLAWRWKSADVRGVHDVIVARTGAAGEKFVPGYHWACAIDDADGDYKILVRAWDLMPVDRIQSEIRRWVKPLQESKVFHTALVVRDDGGRLEKRTQGVTLSDALAKGFSTETLIANFKASFDLETALRQLRASPTASTASQALGETVHKIPVSELLR